MTSAKRSEVFLDLLAQGGNIGLWSCCPPAVPQVWADPAAQRLLQCAPASTLAEWLAAVDAHDRQALLAHVDKAYTQQSGFACTVRLHTGMDGAGGEGEVVHLSLRGRWQASAQAEGGELLCTAERTLAAVDSAELQALQKDREQLQHIEAALLASPVALFEQDCALRYRWIFAPRMGLRAEALIGRVASDFLSPESAAEADQVKAAVIQSGKPARARFNMVAKDHQRGCFDVYVSPVFGSDAQVSGVFTVSVDLTDSDEREGHLLTALEQAPIGIVLSKLSDRRYVYVNARFERLFGYTKEEALGLSSEQLQLWYPPEGSQRFMALLREQGHVRKFPTGFRRKDGHIGRALVSAEMVDIQGQTMLLGMIHDVSALEETRDRLAFSEARYQLMEEASPDGVVLVKDGAVVEANAQMARMLGVPREQAVDTLLSSGLLKEIPVAGLDSNADVSPVGKLHYVRPDGKVLSLEISNRMLVHGGELSHLYTLRDITEQEAKEQSLKYLQASVAHMMDSNVVGMLVADFDGTIVQANDYFLNLLGRTREELQAGALNWMQLTPASSTDIRMRMRELVTRTGDSTPFEKTYWRSDGTAVHMLVAAARLPAQDRMLAIALDVTEQKKYQVELLVLNAQLEKRTQQAERAEAVKTLFLASISHELRTPLHTMLGYVRLLRKKASNEDEEQLGIVERRGTHLLRLIDDLLEFNHTLLAPEDLRADFVGMEGLVNSLESMFNAMAESTGNRFQLKLAPVLPVGVVVDEGRLVQILRILVDNACKYTAEGVVTLTLDSQSQVDGDGKCRLYFAVEDTGRGIAESDIAHIFEPLRRGSNADDKPGLGLGLAIAEQWIQRMGSRIAVQSQPGEGSCFGFELVLEAAFEAMSHWRTPRVQPASPAQASPDAEWPALPAAELAALGQLINMGRMGRLGAWARELGARHPELQAACERLAQLAANADVDALDRMYQRWLVRTH